MRVVPPCRMNWDVLPCKIQGDLFLQEAQGYCSVHHGEVKETVLMQSSAFPFPNKQGLGFSRRWHTPIRCQMNLVLMPLKPSALMLEINTRQMLAKPSAYPPHRATSGMTAPCIRAWHFGSHHTFPALTHRLPLKPQHKHQQGHQS